VEAVSCKAVELGSCRAAELGTCGARRRKGCSSDSPRDLERAVEKNGSELQKID
jgi:hypothetical protein